jgi:hypothetical protein
MEGRRLMATTLVSKKIYTLPSVLPPPPIETPFVKPLSYEFRVVEWMKQGKVSKVTLQFQVWEHDEYGSGTCIQYWTDVERIQIPLP